MAQFYPYCPQLAQRITRKREGDSLIKLINKRFNSQISSISFCYFFWISTSVAVCKGHIYIGITTFIKGWIL